MRTLSIDSSLLSGAQHDADSQVLYLTFRNGARWAYGNAEKPFTSADADELEGADSPGKHFLGVIKGNWPERRA